MNIFEYQAKAILRERGLNVPNGKVASDAETAKQIAQDLGGEAWAVKAQIKTGGRGKAGGIKIAKSLDEVHEFAGKILSTPLQTYQSGGTATKVKTVLIEECCDIANELYFAITIDRAEKSIVCMASAEGGVEIEQTAKEKPEAIFKEHVGSLPKLMPYQARGMAIKMGLKEKKTLNQATKFILQLYEVFVQYDCSLAEVNPLVITSSGDVVVLDAKLGFDDSALFKHPEIVEMRDPDDETASERIARESGLSYIGLDGSIGCMVNGAGLAMATMDTVKLYGAEPANFLDVGGGAEAETVAKAFQILMSDDNVKVILVNIFGGILLCDMLAEGVVAACREAKPTVPLVVRLEGTNVERGRQILSDSGLNIITENTMKAAAQKAVELAKE